MLSPRDLAWLADVGRCRARCTTLWSDPRPAPAARYRYRREGRFPRYGFQGWLDGWLDALRDRSRRALVWISDVLGYGWRRRHAAGRRAGNPRRPSAPPAPVLLCVACDSAAQHAPRRAHESGSAS